MPPLHRQHRTAAGAYAMAAEVDGSYRRVLVPVDSLPYSTGALSLATRFGQAGGGELRLVHLRTWYLSVPRSAGRFYSESSEEATAVLQAAVTFVWDRGLRASGVVVESQRSSAAQAIAAEASQWCADLMVLTARPRRMPGMPVWDKVTRQVVRAAGCPVLLVYPRQR